MIFGYPIELPPNEPMWKSETRTEPVPSTPPPDAPTPLHLLPEQWRGYAETTAHNAAYRLCATELEAVLAAAAGPHRKTAREVLHRAAERQWQLGKLGSEREASAVEVIARALAAASAAARADAWRTHRDGSEHVWEYRVTGRDRDQVFYAEKGQGQCSVCGVHERFVEPPPRPEQGEGPR